MRVGTTSPSKKSSQGLPSDAASVRSDSTAVVRCSRADFNCADAIAGGVPGDESGGRLAGVREDQRRTHSNRRHDLGNRWRYGDGHRSRRTACALGTWRGAARCSRTAGGSERDQAGSRESRRALHDKGNALSGVGVTGSLAGIEPETARSPNSSSSLRHAVGQTTRAAARGSRQPSRESSQHG